MLWGELLKVAPLVVDVFDGDDKKKDDKPAGGDVGFFSGLFGNDDDKDDGDGGFDLGSVVGIFGGGKKKDDEDGDGKLLGLF